MLPKMTHLNILVQAIPAKIANILKQEMLSLGGDAAVARGAVSCSVAETDCVLMGTRKQLDRLVKKLHRQPFAMAALGERIHRLLEDYDRQGYVFSTLRRRMTLGDRTLVMGILNVTPDSFSDGGRYNTVEKAVARGCEMVAQGADMIDVGGESSRPGSLPVPAEEEIRRVVPVVEALASRVGVPISVDTTKAAVAAAALEAGAEIINDISALGFDDRMASVAAETGAGVILMHMRGTPQNMQKGDLTYGDLCGEIVGFLEAALAKARRSAVAEEKTAVDPGIGFGKSAVDNLRIINHLEEFKSLGRPVVIGVSRKSFIGVVTGDEDPERRIEGTAAAVTTAVLRGCAIVRVHDVAFMKKVVAVADALRHA
ncbi:MAG: dihydropteroate synthase, partial [Syntrophales bacterium]|nr:dihydropteroate synthase [Syntrophales bacterium]